MLQSKLQIKWYWKIPCFADVYYVSVLQFLFFSFYWINISQKNILISEATKVGIKDDRLPLEREKSFMKTLGHVISGARGWHNQSQEWLWSAKTHAGCFLL